MSSAHDTHLSRRERQIMDVIFRLGKASAGEVLEAMPDPPSYSAVRAHLRILEEKGHLRHEQSGKAYVYSPKQNPKRAGKKALRRVMQTFFDNSAANAVAALLDAKERDLTEEELERMAALIEEARNRGDGK